MNLYRSLHPYMYLSYAEVKVTRLYCGFHGACALYSFRVAHEKPEEEILTEIRTLGIISFFGTKKITTKRTELRIAPII